MNSLSTPNNIFPTSPLPQNTKAGQKVYKESLAISVSSLKNSGTSVSQKCTYNQEEQSTTQGIFFPLCFWNCDINIMQMLYSWGFSQNHFKHWQKMTSHKMESRWGTLFTSQKHVLQHRTDPSVRPKAKGTCIS